MYNINLDFRVDIITSLVMVFFKGLFWTFKGMQDIVDMMASKGFFKGLFWTFPLSDTHGRSRLLLTSRRDRPWVSDDGTICKTLFFSLQIYISRAFVHTQLTNKENPDVIKVLVFSPVEENVCTDSRNQYTNSLWFTKLNHKMLDNGASRAMFLKRKLMWHIQVIIFSGIYFTHLSKLGIVAIT